MDLVRLNRLPVGNMDIVPIFSTHYSLVQGGILTLEEPGKTKDGNPVSVFDLAQQSGLKQVVLVESKPDGFVEAVKNIKKVGSDVKLIFGLKIVLCADMMDKSDQSLSTQHSIIIFIRNTNGYNDLLKIWNRAATDGFYYSPRADAQLLKTWWTPNLTLALPYFSSFLYKNSLSMAKIVPDLPVKCPIILKEIDSDLPFSPVIDQAIDRYVEMNCAGEGVTESPILNCKTIYYAKNDDFKKYLVYRAILGRASFDKPQIDHFSSNTFSWESYLDLTKSPNQSINQL